MSDHKLDVINLGKYPTKKSDTTGVVYGFTSLTCLVSCIGEEKITGDKRANSHNLTSDSESMSSKNSEYSFRGYFEKKQSLRVGHLCLATRS